MTTTAPSLSYIIEQVIRLSTLTNPDVYEQVSPATGPRAAHRGLPPPSFIAFATLGDFRIVHWPHDQLHVIHTQCPGPMSVLEIVLRVTHSYSARVRRVYYGHYNVSAVYERLLPMLEVALVMDSLALIGLPPNE